MLDLIIIGGGPGGVAAGVYASRKRLATELITKEWGGQSVVSPDIQNWVGTISVTGNDFAEMLKKHLEAYKSDTLTVTPNTPTKLQILIPDEVAQPGSSPGKTYTSITPPTPPPAQTSPSRARMFLTRKVSPTAPHATDRFFPDRMWSWSAAATPDLKRPPSFSHTRKA